MEPASEERRREQNRLAQRRFRQKHRQQGRTSEQQTQRAHSLGSGSTESQQSDILAEGALLSPESMARSLSLSSMAALASTVGMGLPSAGIDQSNMSLSSRSSGEQSLCDPSSSLGAGGEPNLWAPLMDGESGMDVLYNTPPMSTHALQTVYGSTIGSGGLALLDERPTDRLMTSLHVAAQRGNSRIVRLLLENNADCNMRDSEGLTPLLHATIAGHEEVVDLLLSHGARLDHVDDEGRSALHWSVLRDRSSLLRKLLKWCAGNTEVLERQTREGSSPLLLAVGRNCEAAVELLLASGAKAR